MRRASGPLLLLAKARNLPSCRRATQATFILYSSASSSFTNLCRTKSASDWGGIEAVVSLPKGPISLAPSFRAPQQGASFGSKKYALAGGAQSHTNCYRYLLFRGAGTGAYGPPEWPPLRPPAGPRRAGPRHCLHAHPALPRHPLPRQRRAVHNGPPQRLHR